METLQELVKRVLGKETDFEELENIKKKGVDNYGK